MAAVIELRRARALVRGHRLRMLERTAIAEISGDAGRAERVIADRRMNAGRYSSPADHAPGVGLGHWSVSERHGVVTWAGSKEPALAIVSDAGSVDVGPQHLRKRGGTASRAACRLSREAAPASLRPLGEDPLPSCAAPRDAGEGIGEGGDERAVAQVPQGFGRNALDERAPLVALEDRRLAGLHDVLRSAHGRGRI